ncbi:MAG: prepilin-type N-terminal cleavage/methylation domain-containing protein [Simkaniaceae bacterium]|nr:prepilin-type N-terminal cleavage/methylation domain-containing protein [Simkaniaceae bacterium]
MKQKKYSFTLMEVMIGFTLISLVLGMIFSSLYQEATLKRSIEKMEKAVMTHVEVQQFLDRVFANHLSSPLKGSQKPFYTKDDPRAKLSITFDNGIDPNPLFCGEIEGILCIENNALVFKLKEGESFERTAVLRKEVNALSFEFLTNGDHGLETHSTWSENRPFSPSFVKITLNRNEPYAFWVNQASQEIPLKTKKEGQG